MDYLCVVSFACVRLSLASLFAFPYKNWFYFISIAVLSQNTRKQKTVSLFSLKNSSFRFKLERRKRSDLTMDATLGTENNPTVISGKTRSIVSRPFRSLFFFAAVRQVTASFAISLFLSLSLSLDVVALNSRACS